MVVESKKSINPDLLIEREKGTFDVEELAKYWIGDEQKLLEKRARGKLPCALILTSNSRFFFSQFPLITNDNKCDVMADSERASESSCNRPFSEFMLCVFVAGSSGAEVQQ